MFGGCIALNLLVNSVVYLFILLVVVVCLFNYV